MAISRDELLSKIDNMKIYKKDYDVIVNLLNNTTPETFTKILEEVANGNLRWSDFEEFLSTTSYERIITETIGSQLDVSRKLKKYVTMKKRFDKDFSYKNSQAGIAIINSTDPNEKEFYSKEFAKVRDDLLFELTKIDSRDTTLSLAVKVRLYNMIQNGKIAKSETESGYSIVNGSAVNGDKNYESIDPNDIFLFLDSYLIPVEPKNQVLNSFDRLFQERHNIDDETMKKFKAILLFLRQRGLGGSNA